jgi:hypothetical protein
MWVDLKAVADHPQAGETPALRVASRIDPHAIAH